MARSERKDWLEPIVPIAAIFFLYFFMRSIFVIWVPDRLEIAPNVRDHMCDGVDGLCGAVTAIALIWFAIVGALVGKYEHMAVLLVLVAAVVGFLVFNLRYPWQQRAHVFLGNGGSMILGLSLSWFAIDLTQNNNYSVPPIVTIWIISIPLLNMGGVLLHRYVKGKSLFSADRKHLHHILLLVGYSESEAVVRLLIISTIFGGLGIAAWQLGVPEYVMFYSFIILFISYYFVVYHTWKMARTFKQTSLREQ